jgi:integrase
MPHKSAAPAGHTGRTAAGNTRDVIVERVGPVTIYKRGNTYSLYYRQAGVTHRRKVDGNLAVARTTAHEVGRALAQDRPSPLAFDRTAPRAFAAAYLGAVAGVQKLALRTQDRYKAALDRFTDFCDQAGVKAVDAVTLATVEDFVRWLRGQRRARNGSAAGSRAQYKVGGIKFILSTCRTAYNWAARRRMLPPYTENPFRLFPVDKLKDAAEEPAAGKVFTPEQERAFFATGDPWEQRAFGVLAAYGLRVAELTHLLIEDVDLARGVFTVRPKAWLLWNVKTGRERQLPLLPQTRDLFAAAINGRAAGFVFVNPAVVAGGVPAFAGPEAFRVAARKALDEPAEADPGAGERDRKRAAVAFCRAAGQVPEKAVRERFMKLTKAIGCPGFTRVHDLRHLFACRAQAAGVNPILVQEMLGHTTLDMTRRYTHLGIDTKRDALARAIAAGGVLQTGGIDGQKEG